MPSADKKEQKSEGDLSGDNRTSLASKSFLSTLERGDQGLTVRVCLDEGEARLNLGQHGTLGELAFLHVLLSLGQIVMEASSC